MKQMQGRRNAGYALAEDVRYNERSAAERVNGGLKDDFSGRYVRVRGPRQGVLPPDVRRPRAGHRSPDAIDHVIPDPAGTATTIKSNNG
jgi:hypothetical protein